MNPVKLKPGIYTCVARSTFFQTCTRNNDHDYLKNTFRKILIGQQSVERETRMVNVRERVGTERLVNNRRIVDSDSRISNFPSRLINENRDARITISRESQTFDFPRLTNLNDRTIDSRQRFLNDRRISTNERATNIRENAETSTDNHRIPNRVSRISYRRDSDVLSARTSRIQERNIREVPTEKLGSHISDKTNARAAVREQTNDERRFVRNSEISRTRFVRDTTNRDSRVSLNDRRSVNRNLNIRTSQNDIRDSRINKNRFMQRLERERVVERDSRTSSDRSMDSRFSGDNRVTVNRDSLLSSRQSVERRTHRDTRTSLENRRAVDRNSQIIRQSTERTSERNARVFIDNRRVIDQNSRISSEDRRSGNRDSRLSTRRFTERTLERDSTSSSDERRATVDRDSRTSIRRSIERTPESNSRASVDERRIINRDSREERSLGRGFRNSISERTYDKNSRVFVDRTEINRSSRISTPQSTERTSNRDSRNSRQVFSHQSIQRTFDRDSRASNDERRVVDRESRISSRRSIENMSDRDTRASINERRIVNPDSRISTTERTSQRDSRASIDERRIADRESRISNHRSIENMSDRNSRASVNERRVTDRESRISSRRSIERTSDGNSRASINERRTVDSDSRISITERTSGRDSQASLNERRIADRDSRISTPRFTERTSESRNMNRDAQILERRVTERTTERDSQASFQDRRISSRRYNVLGNNRASRFSTEDRRINEHSSERSTQHLPEDRYSRVSTNNILRVSSNRVTERRENFRTVRDIRESSNLRNNLDNHRISRAYNNRVAKLRFVRDVNIQKREVPALINERSLDRNIAAERSSSHLISGNSRTDSNTRNRQLEFERQQAGDRRFVTRNSQDLNIRQRERISQDLRISEVKRENNNRLTRDVSLSNKLSDDRLVNNREVLQRQSRASHHQIPTYHSSTTDENNNERYQTTADRLYSSNYNGERKYTLYGLTVGKTTNVSTWSSLVTTTLGVLLLAQIITNSSEPKKFRLPYIASFLHAVKEKVC